MADSSIKRVVVVFGGWPLRAHLDEHGACLHLPAGSGQLLPPQLPRLPAAAMEAEATPFITKLGLKKDDPAM
jgi:hypothetical protein